VPSSQVNTCPARVASTNACSLEVRSSITQ
jgi:hypothetical protein